MVGVLQRSSFLLLSILLTVPAWCGEEADEVAPHTNVALRMVGHAILLNAGDTTSLVLPVEREGNRYRISFGSEFAFVPEELAATVDSVISATRLANSYVVEVAQCGTGEVVYSYEIGVADTLDIIPCRSRALPRACYTVRISIAEGPEDQLAGVAFGGPIATEGNGRWVLGLLVMLLFALVVYFMWRKKATPGIVTAESGVLIGAFRFDRGKMELTIQDRKVELSGKEADLLHLLHSCANETVERDVMLKEVWGNEGDYVGRTLDVFISKLRKKLEADPNVRIANIRGVGYRLILNS